MSELEALKAENSELRQENEMLEDTIITLRARITQMEEDKAKSKRKAAFDDSFYSIAASKITWSRDDF